MKSTSVLGVSSIPTKKEKMILSLLLWQRLMVATDCPKIAICQCSTTVVQFTCNERVAGSNPVVGFA